MDSDNKTSKTSAENTEPPTYDWEGLREKLNKEMAGVRNKSIAVTLPGQYSTASRVLSNTSDGIHPVRDPLFGSRDNPKSKYYYPDKGNTNE